MIEETFFFPEPKEFEWDAGNERKNVDKHRVTKEEAEQVFLNDPLVSPDLKHSKTEKRFYCLGHTDKKRGLFIAFTIRNNKIRIISARDQHKKEREIYAKAS